MLASEILSNAGYNHQTIQQGIAYGGLYGQTRYSRSRELEADHYGISFAVNEDLTISAGRQEVDFSGSGLEDEESSGMSASYTMGGLTIAGHANSTDSQDGASGEDEESKSINFAFAF